MKHFYLLFTVLVFTSCLRSKIEIKGSVYGIPNATLSLKDGSGQTLASVNAKDNQFILQTSTSNDPTYATLTLSQPGKDDINTELYLEPGTYTVKYKHDDIQNYPQVTATSGVQNQLSAFHKLFEHMNLDVKRRISLLDLKYRQAIKSKQLWNDSLSHLAEKVEAERSKLSDISRAALAVFLTKYPKSPIGLHVFQTLDYESNPVAYLALFKKLSPQQQTGDDGKTIGNRLNALVHLVPGQLAPQIVGVMPNGKPLDLKSLHRKVILIEFWRAANYGSRLNHQTMVNNPWPVFTNNQIAIVSVSFDKKRDWWLGSMRDDKLTWPQVSDLKGQDSPNFENWGIDHLPTYYLVDDTGHILENNLEFGEIPLAANKYLKTAKL